MSGIPTCHGILLSYKEQQTIDTCKNLDESQWYYSVNSKWKKANLKSFHTV